MDPSPPPILPPPARTAFLLDVDGTLLDIAPTPDSVVVPASLPGDLRRLREALDGAVAVVTGRPVEQVEALLGDAAPVVAGEHGGAFRFGTGAALERMPLPELPAEWWEVGERAVAAHPGALFERKARGFVFHFRAVPEAGLPLQEVAERLVASRVGEFQLTAAHMAWEVRPRGADKGRAVELIMARAPFAGRRPVFVGDDTTDLDGMAAAHRLGGAGLFVPQAFGSAAAVRAWLGRCAVRPDAPAWPALPHVGQTGIQA